MPKTFKKYLPGAVVFLCFFIYRFSFRDDFRSIEMIQILLNAFADFLITYAVIFIIKRANKRISIIQISVIQYIIRFFIYVSSFFIGVYLLKELHYLVHLNTTGMSEQFSVTFQRTSYQIFDAYLVLAFGMMMLMGWHFYYQSLLAKAEKELAQKEKTTAELNYLKAQINPHFIFNTLNNINFLIDDSNTQARELMQDFCELLRYQLYEISAEKVKIAKEIEYLENYIRIQRVRKEHGFKVEFIHTHLPDLDIAPMLLIIPLENAFKFSDSSDKGFIISSLTYSSDKLLTYLIRNSVDPRIKSSQTNGGLGLNNLKKRLSLIYKDKFNFTTEHLPNEFISTLTIQF